LSRWCRRGARTKQPGEMDYIEWMDKTLACRCMKNQRLKKFLENQKKA